MHFIFFLLCLSSLPGRGVVEDFTFFVLNVFSFLVSTLIRSFSLSYRRPVPASGRLFAQFQRGRVLRQASDDQGVRRAAGIFIWLFGDRRQRVGYRSSGPLAVLLSGILIYRDYSFCVWCWQ